MLEDDNNRVGEIEDRAIGRDNSRARNVWVSVCLVFAATSVGYRILVLGELEQTSLMFIGLPTMLAMGLGVTPRSRTATGMILKGSILFLLLLGVLFIEGVICILMALPLVLLVGVIVGAIIDSNRKRNLNIDNPLWWKDKMNCSVLASLALVSLEGVSESLSFARDEVVQVTGVWEGTGAEAKQKLAQPNFDLDELPTFLKLGFPLPQSIHGEGLEVGSVWQVHMAGGEGEPGDVKVVVKESSDQKVRFRLVKDTSHIAHWLHWRDITWEFKEGDEPNKTEVTMTIEYDRLLDPAWYFKPVERYGVRKAGEYFLEQLYEEHFHIE